MAGDYNVNSNYPHSQQWGVSPWKKDSDNTSITEWDKAKDSIIKMLQEQLSRLQQLLADSLGTIFMDADGKLRIKLPDAKEVVIENPEDFKTALDQIKKNRTKRLSKDQYKFSDALVESNISPQLWESVKEWMALK